MHECDARGAAPPGGPGAGGRIAASSRTDPRACGRGSRPETDLPFCASSEAGPDLAGRAEQILAPGTRPLKCCCAIPASCRLRAASRIAPASHASASCGMRKARCWCPRRCRDPSQQPSQPLVEVAAQLLGGREDGIIGGVDRRAGCEGGEADRVDDEYPQRFVSVCSAHASRPAGTGISGRTRRRNERGWGVPALQGRAGSDY